MICFLISMLLAQDLAKDSDEFGASVVGLREDIDSDGTVDYAIGSPSEGAGIVRVISGMTGKLAFSCHAPESVTQFGSSAVSAGDLDGDGLCDLVVAGLDAVAAYGAKGKLLWVKAVDPQFSYNAAEESVSGPSLCGLSDVNHDGFPDIAIGLPFWNDSTSRSRAIIINGKDAAVIDEIASLPGKFGASLYCLGDIADSGKIQLAVGAPASRVGQPGTVYIMEVNNDDPVKVFQGLPGQFSFGYAIGSSLFNGNAQEIYVGAPSFGREDALSSVLVYDFTSGSLLRSLAGASEEHCFGARLVSVGGKQPGLLIGSPARLCGRALFFPRDQSQSVVLECDKVYSSWCGKGCDAVGDIDLDGFEDVAVGGGGKRAWGGEVRVFSGKDWSMLRHSTARDY